MTNIKTVSIEDENVTTEKLADQSVTSAKIEDGAVGEDQLADGGITGAKIGDGEVGTTQIADLGVTNGKLADNSITGIKILDNSITGPKIQDGSIGPEKLAPGTIDQAVIADGSVIADKIANGAVGTLQLADESVTSAKIPTNTISLNRLVNGQAGSVLARDNTGVTVAIAPGVAGSVLTMSNGQPQFLSPLIPTGAIIDYWGAAAPNGWISCDGRTIGPLGSAATGLSDASAEALFKHIWNNFGNSIAPVVPSRGASADADWAAGTKVITLPDLRGRVTVCVDTEVGSVAAQTVITDAQFGGDVSTVGIMGGSSVHVLAENEMPPHKHALFTDATVLTDDQLPDGEVTVGYRRNLPGSISTEYHFNFSEAYVQPTVARTGVSGGADVDALVAEPHKNIQASVIVLKIIKI